jgi:diguanylate cyclase (GGDEF)-like protein
LWLVGLAAIICCLGAASGFALCREALRSPDAKSRLIWGSGFVLATSSAIWSTHFIAMLAYEPGMMSSFDIGRTVLSFLIAFALVGAGALMILAAPNLAWRIAGAAVIGMAISAMHYTGMGAYEVQGDLRWNLPMVAVSVMSGTILTALVALPVFWIPRRWRWCAPALFVLAVCSTHFIAMGAFDIAIDLTENVPTETINTNMLAVLVTNVVFVIIALSLTSVWLAMRHRREHVRTAARMLALAHQDSLTGLANRLSFTEALAKRYSGPSDAENAFALLLLDLDRFKAINDTLGHGMGDELLRRVAKRLKRAAGEDFVARLGGDEFAIIVDAGVNGASVRTRAEQVNDLLSRPFVVQGHVLEIAASIGIALAHADGADPAELARCADLALYRAKQEGANTYRFFETEMSLRAHARRMLELDLRRAIVRQEFEVYYQPQVHSRSGEFNGAEALIRWNHPDRGMISPAEFIPLAEEIGLIGSIGEWVLRTACAEATSWPEHLSIAVNLSPVQFRDPHLAANIAAILAETGLKPSRLELELTENALLQNEGTTYATLHDLRARGIRISMDDFGTGYSSLSYLRRFPFDKIKIDQSFIRQIPADPDSIAIVQAVTSLGAKLGMTVTVEGVETPEQHAFSVKEGCDQLQGYLFSKPVPAAKVRELLAARPAALAG